LVEGEKTLAATLKSSLEGRGYAVALAGGGKAAVDLCTEGSSFDLVLMGLGPDGGTESLEAARSILRSHDLPLIFLVSGAEREAAADLGELSPCGYALKDAGIAVLDAAIQTALRLRGRRFESARQESENRDPAYAEEFRLKSIFLEAVMNSSADGILVVDQLGKKVLQNQRTVELWKIPPDVAADPNGDRQVAHIMGATKNPERFLAEIQHQMKFPMETTTDQLELVDGTVLDRHSQPVLGADGKNYGRIYHFHDVTGFRQAEERIRGLLAEKEIILREVHHRVKNYMGTLLSLLSLQAASLTEPSAIEALKDAQGRVQNMVLLYEKLFVLSDTGSVLISSYISELIEEIIAAYPKFASVSVEKRIGDFALNAKTMQVLGMIANELLTNIMKYAFVGRPSGKITVSAGREGRRVSFSVQDDGIGMPESVSFDSSSGFGLMLVGLLVKQLDGSIRIDRGGGTKFSLEFDA
jgi:two-component sensor histidine kinase/DNA-binding response OmpR family regulator